MNHIVVESNPNRRTKKPLQRIEKESFKNQVKEFSFSSYELLPKSILGPLNGQQPRKGALLKVKFEDGVLGYADCHPWTELGDLPLHEQLNRISGSEITSLGRCSLKYARIDGEARARGRSVWEGLEIPASHALVGNLKDVTPEYLEALSQQGFRILKIKMGIDLSLETELLQSLAPAFQTHSFKLRFDFNSRLSAIQLEEFLENLGEIRDRVDFIEDPTPYDARAWAQTQRRWGIRLALDRLPPELSQRPEGADGPERPDCPDSRDRSDLPSLSGLPGLPGLPGLKDKWVPHSFSILVLKPAIQDPEVFFDLASQFRASVVVTSYLDHPLGQLAAARVAAQAIQRPDLAVETCGLLSHLVYEPNLFSNELKVSGPYLLAPQGVGFGMDKTLSELKWEQI